MRSRIKLSHFYRYLMLSQERLNAPPPLRSSPPLCILLGPQSLSATGRGRDHAAEATSLTLSNLSGEPPSTPPIPK